ncbi:hypothetical protein M758_8G032000 [Ceratodon purpureus]|nr:hypothetical protein M758_8G032000 [Ceratodon purpureus]
MSSTEIINKTGKALKLKVGNNLVFTDLTVVPKDSSYKVHVDPNATYQEYLMGKDRNGRPLIISSDDCADNKSITIMEDDDGNFNTIKKPRTTAPAPPPVRLGDESGSGKSSSKIWKFFSSFRSSSSGR